MKMQLFNNIDAKFLKKPSKNYDHVTVEPEEEFEEKSTSFEDTNDNNSKEVI